MRRRISSGNSVRKRLTERNDIDRLRKNGKIHLAQIGEVRLGEKLRFEGKQIDGKTFQSMPTNIIYQPQ